jgi:hypothetical protein
MVDYQIRVDGHTIDNFSSPRLTFMDRARTIEEFCKQRGIPTRGVVLIEK